MLRQREHFVAFIVWFRTIIRICSEKLFCWFTAVCESFISTSINKRIDILYFFDQCSIFSNSLVNVATFVGIRYDILRHFLEFQALQRWLLRYVLTNPILFWCKQDRLLVPVKSPIYSYPLQVTSTIHENVFVVKCIALSKLFSSVIQTKDAIKAVSKFDVKSLCWFLFQLAL